MNVRAVSHRPWRAALFTWVLTGLCTGGVLFAEPGGAPDATSAPLDLGSRRELFVDDLLIAELSGGARRRLHSPVPREVVLAHDAPWEGNATCYYSIFRDGDRVRMYYRAQHLAIADGRLAPSAENLCYAESDDGLHWRKPELGLHEFQGSRANNIVLTRDQFAAAGLTLGAPAVFRDLNPAAPPEARYKAFLMCRAPLGMVPFQSPDGLHWSPLCDQPTIVSGAFDSQNIVFWDAHRGEYRAYWRIFTEGVTTGEVWEPAGRRAIRTATSPDLVQWSAATDLTYADSPPEELYENCLAPYPRAPHLLLGFPVRYVDRAGAPSASVAGDGVGADEIADWPRSLLELPEREHRTARAALSERFGSALTETLLMVSRDGAHFTRWNEAFLRPGPQRPGSWNYGQQFVGWGLLETPADLPGAPPEYSLFATEGSWTTSGTSLRRYTLRQDGFVSIEAPLSGGELRTPPLTFAGARLSVNFSTSAAGSLRVELQSPDGTPIPGFALSDCDELFGDALDRTVSWQGSADVSALAGQALRLRFVLQDAELFALQFHAP